MKNDKRTQNNLYIFIKIMKIFRKLYNLHNSKEINENNLDYSAEENILAMAQHNK